MQERIQKKLVLPVLALAIVGVAGSVYTMAHSGPMTVHAQTAAVTRTQAGQDKETQDDVISPKPSQTVQQKADTTENDTAGTNSAAPDGEDSN